MITRHQYINQSSPIEKELKVIFSKKQPAIIFDIGSCEGEDSIKYSRLFPSSKIYAVEALPNNINLLRKNLDKYRVTNVQILPFALSDKNGMAKFYISSGEPEHKEEDEDWDYGNKSSSLLTPSKNIDVIPWLNFRDSIDIQTKKLKDVCFELGIQEIDFIHLDVQGAELKVLEGADDLIGQVKVIWLEVEAVALYENQPVKANIEQFMQKHNFYKIKDTVDNISGDQLYINIKQLSKSLIMTKLVIHQFIYIRDKLGTKFNFNFLKSQNKKISYSQCGEDLIIKFIFDSMGIKHPSYIDIGAHDPEYLSNTAIFYLNGSRGINIEPDQNLFRTFLSKRHRDINLNIGISNTKGEMDLHIMSSPTLNTYSKAEVEKYVVDGKYHVKSIQSIKVDTISNVISNYWNGYFPDFLSLDVEGLDKVVLESIDYENVYPIVICVETISFSENGTGVKNTSIINLLESKGYMIFADTYINTIFVKKNMWIKGKN